MLFRVTMPTLPPGRRPLSPASRAGLGAALVLLAVVSAVELADGPGASFVGLLAAVPFLAAVFAFWQTVLAVGVLAATGGAVFVGRGGPLGVSGMVNILGIMLATGIAAAVATIRQRQADRIVELQRLPRGAPPGGAGAGRPGGGVGAGGPAGGRARGGRSLHLGARGRRHRRRPLRGAGHAVRG